MKEDAFQETVSSSRTQSGETRRLFASRPALRTDTKSALVFGLDLPVLQGKMVASWLELRGHLRSNRRSNTPPKARTSASTWNGNDIFNRLLVVISICPAAKRRSTQLSVRANSLDLPTAGTFTDGHEFHSGDCCMSNGAICRHAL
jgi:hypothetical protein